jgi:hypothetical protein
MQVLESAPLLCPEPEQPAGTVGSCSSSHSTGSWSMAQPEPPQVAPLVGLWLGGARRLGQRRPPRVLWRHSRCWCCTAHSPRAPCRPARIEQTACPAISHDSPHSSSRASACRGAHALKRPPPTTRTAHLTAPPLVTSPPCVPGVFSGSVGSRAFDLCTWRFHWLLGELRFLPVDLAFSLAQWGALSFEPA